MFFSWGNILGSSGVVASCCHWYFAESHELSLISTCTWNSTAYLWNPDWSWRTMLGKCLPHFELVRRKMGPYISHHWHHPSWICQSWALKYKYNTWWHYKWDRPPLSIATNQTLEMLPFEKVRETTGLFALPFCFKSWLLGVDHLTKTKDWCLRGDPAEYYFVPRIFFLFGWFLIRTLRILVDYAFTVLLTLHSGGIVTGAWILTPM